MKREMLTEKQKNEIKKLTENGHSLKEIAQKLGKGKTTIYYHFRKIKGRTVHFVVLNLNNDELLGEFIGLVAGDGCLYKTKQYHYRVYLCFNITEKKYVDELASVLFPLFGIYPLRIRRENRLILVYCSKQIFSLVCGYLTWNPMSRKCHTVRLIKRDHSKKFKIGFIRGNLDSDGYLSDKKISFASTSHYLINDIMSYLSDLDITFHYAVYKEKRSNKKDMHHVNIRKAYSEKFLHMIKPRERKNLSASAGI